MSKSPPSPALLQPDLTAVTRRNRKVIRLLLAATFVVILNETIMSVALSELMTDLDITARAAQWLSTAFMLTMAVVIPVTGFLLQRFNTRPVYTAAMTLFSAGTLIAALAPGFEVLLLGRIVQACGTAIMMPLLMTTLMTLVPPAERGKTMGNVSIVISVAPAIGPTISGIILNALSWRWMFLLVLPIAVAMLLIGARRVENVTEPRPVPLDVPSVLLSAAGFGGLIYGLSTVGAGDGGDGGPVVPLWASIGGGAVALAVFILRQLRLQKRDRALLDLRTFRAPIFSLAVGMMTVSMAALFGTIILLPIYLQQVLGLEPVQIGLMLLPGGLLMGLLAPAVGRLYDRSGPRVLLVPGTAIVSAVLWFLSTLHADTPPMLVLAAHLVLSLGLALLFTPLFTAGLGAVRPELYSHGSAIVGTVQQVAGAAGTALFVTVLSVQSAALSAAGQTQTVAVAGGVQAAFLTGAVISLAAIVGAFFIRKPAEIPAESLH
ncbi:DHA2 family efflux MFS transporter permease subunit [Arthrobacter sp. I2-34]|uniref:DHA2 family efflux MFS transporter permease subunit n=1 Tax=Arthrobacter hankyongi TaxID=2904801 RepID=A0ABS9L3J0_9MICC|nr:MDR family MFS transporter [Arthrobacter hankyongi]MCG2621267.1 DHA2 family efflux MFS transporter permease subunit [Arthrobacter hankyongi]